MIPPASSMPPKLGADQIPRERRTCLAYPPDWSTQLANAQFWRALLVKRKGFHRHVLAGLYVRALRADVADAARSAPESAPGARWSRHSAAAGRGARTAERWLLGALAQRVLQCPRIIADQPQVDDLDAEFVRQHPLLDHHPIELLWHWRPGQDAHAAAGGHLAGEWLSGEGRAAAPKP